MKEGSAIFLYYRNFGLGQILKWMTGIHRIEWLASINVALKRCQTELFHLSFKCSVHCLVISHHPFFIISSGYLLRERVRGTKIWDSGTIIQFNSIQCSSSIIESFKVSSIQSITVWETIIQFNFIQFNALLA